MKSKPLTFSTMTAVLLSELPELKARYDRELEKWQEEMGQHIIYRYVLYAAIEDELKSRRQPDDVFLRRAFAFLEPLIDHPEAHVREVAHQSVCDKICADEVVLQKAQRYMGKKTRDLCVAISGSRPR